MIALKDIKDQDKVNSTLENSDSELLHSDLIPAKGSL